ncbi:MAG: efflux RND transporter periplasmic adaptor subunit [Gallionella sp.]
MNRSILILMLSAAARIAHAAPDYLSSPLRDVAIYPELGASAQVVSLNESRISAEITARVERIPVEAGQVVEKGAVLASLDCRNYLLAETSAAAALKSSEARAHLAELQLERSKTLRGQNYISASGLDAQLAQTEIARAEVELSRSNYEVAQNTRGKCTVYAPYRAVVMERIAQVGEMLSPGGPVLAIRDLSSIEVRADVQEDGNSIRAAKEITFRTQSGNYPVKLIRLSSALTVATRVLEARLAFTGPAALTGSTGRISWRTNVMHLPPSVIVRREGQLGIYVVDRDQPRFVALPRAEEGRPAAVTDLPANSLIVVNGQEKL